MASTPTKLTTFAEFERLPDPPEGYRLELRHGEPVSMAPPKIDHSRVQWRIRRLLERAAAEAGVVTNEIGFRATDDINYRIADVAYVSQQRWNAAKDYLIGAPEIVVEVISPSNSAAEMNDKESLCLANGCLESWLVDPDLKSVRVSTPDGHAVMYRAGQSISVATLNGASIAIDEIFPPAQFFVTCKRCKIPMKELKGHVYHKQRKFKCPQCGRARMQAPKRAPR